MFVCCESESSIMDVEVICEFIEVAEMYASDV